VPCHRDVKSNADKMPYICNYSIRER
jgi:hypothetical protein